MLSAAHPTTDIRRRQIFILDLPKRHFPRMIERSRCPKCEIRMMRVGVERSFAGPDLRTLECPKCELAYKALAEDQ
jgi:hypothetical protein